MELSIDTRHPDDVKRKAMDQAVREAAAREGHAHMNMISGAARFGRRLPSADASDVGDIDLRALR